MAGRPRLRLAGTASPVPPVSRSRTWRKRLSSSSSAASMFVVFITLIVSSLWSSGLSQTAGMSRFKEQKGAKWLAISQKVAILRAPRYLKTLVSALTPSRQAASVEKHSLSAGQQRSTLPCRSLSLHIGQECCGPADSVYLVCPTGARSARGWLDPASATKVTGAREFSFLNRVTVCGNAITLFS